MATATDFPARGRVKEVNGSTVVFQPAGTTYELHLAGNGSVTAGDVPVDVLIRARARKVMSVPSGGNFVTPIFGTPRIVQGRVRWLDEQQLVLQAGCPIIVDLPAEASIDLNAGPITVGNMVNVALLPGATIELLQEVAL